MHNVMKRLQMQVMKRLQGFDDPLSQQHHTIDRRRLLSIGGRAVASRVPYDVHEDPARDANLIRRAANARIPRLLGMLLVVIIGQSGMDGNIHSVEQPIACEVIRAAFLRTGGSNGGLVRAQGTWQARSRGRATPGFERLHGHWVGSPISVSVIVGFLLRHQPWRRASGRLPEATLTASCFLSRSARNASLTSMWSCPDSMFSSSLASALPAASALFSRWL